MLEKLREQEAAYEAAKDDVARLKALLGDDNWRARLFFRLLRQSRAREIGSFQGHQHFMEENMCRPTCVFFQNKN